MPRAKKRKRTGTPIAAYTIAEFCEAHGISVTMYYILRKRKQAPREMRIGKRYLISQEAAADWRVAREQ